MLQAKILRVFAKYILEEHSFRIQPMIIHTSRQQGKKRSQEQRSWDVLPRYC